MSMALYLEPGSSFFLVFRLLSRSLGNCRRNMRMRHPPFNQPLSSQMGNVRNKNGKVPSLLLSPAFRSSIYLDFSPDCNTLVNSRISRWHSSHLSNESSFFLLSCIFSESPAENMPVGMATAAIPERIYVAITYCRQCCDRPPQPGKGVLEHFWLCIVFGGIHQQ